MPPCRLRGHTGPFLLVHDEGRVFSLPNVLSVALHGWQEAPSNTGGLATC